MTGPTFVFLLAISGQGPAGFEVRTLGGEPVSGEVQGLAADGSLTVDGKVIAGGEWYSIRRAPGTLPAWPRAPHLELTTGDRLVGTVIDADGDALRLRVAAVGGNQVLRFPLSSLRAVWLISGAADAADPDWLAAPRKRDVIQARNGDLAVGALTGIDTARNVVTYQADGKDRRLDLARTAAVGFNTDLARVRRPKGPYYRLTLTDGSRLGVVSLAFDGQSWTAVTLFKDALRLPREQVVSVDVEQGKVASLADVKPSKYQYQPFDGEEHSWVADRSVAGRAMRLKMPAGESTFDRGVGLHAECRVTYALAGKYRRFESLAGLDARTGIRGDAVLAVLVDGKEQPLPGSGRLTTPGGPIAVSVNVSGGKELTIAVRRGAAGNVQDHVNLAEARLVP
jgi:hypothetical protein